MGDSITVFIPVLEEAVRAEAKKVEAERAAQQQPIVENLVVAAKPIETSVERQEESSSSSNEDSRPEETVTQRLQQTSRIMTSILQPPIKSVIAAQQLHFNDTKVTETDSKRTIQTTTIEQDNVHLKPPPALTRRPLSRRSPSSGSKRSKRAPAPKRRVVPIRVFLLVVAIGWVLFALWKTCSWVGIFGSEPVPECKPVPAIANETLQSPVAVDRKAVYLRDLEERGVLYSNLQPPYVDSVRYVCYKLVISHQLILCGLASNHFWSRQPVKVQCKVTAGAMIDTVKSHLS